MKMNEKEERESMEKFLELVKNNPKLKQSIEKVAEDLEKVKKIIDKNK